MDQAILESFRNSGEIVHVIFVANNGEHRWRNGRFLEIGREGSLFKTEHGDTIALTNSDIVRIEPREFPRQRGGGS